MIKYNKFRWYSLMFLLFITVYAKNDIVVPVILLCAAAVISALDQIEQAIREKDDE